MPLSSLGITRELQDYTGDHSLAYWSSHVPGYLKFDSTALCRRSGVC